MKHWLRKQALILSLATANLERSILKNTGVNISDDANTVQKHRQGTLSDDLLNGKETEEVIKMRARMYKVLNATESATIKEVPAHATGEPSDNYPIKLIMDNRTSFKILQVNDGTDDEIPSLIISRDITPRFKLEDYTEKFYIKKIPDSDRYLIELFISKLNDINNKKVSFLIKSIERAIQNPRTSDILDIKDISFTTDNAIGVHDFLEYKYSDISFSKIVDYNGYYVIKFTCSEIISGVNIFDIYKNEKVEHAYNNKLPRNS